MNSAEQLNAALDELIRRKPGASEDVEFVRRFAKAQTQYADAGKPQCGRLHSDGWVVEVRVNNEIAMSISEQLLVMPIDKDDLPELAGHLRDALIKVDGGGLRLSAEIDLMKAQAERERAAAEHERAKAKEILVSLNPAT